jgi:hypothetical protein
MTVSRIKKPVAAVKPASTLRETALVQQLEGVQMELSKARAEVAEAKAELATVQAKLEATKRPRKPIFRIAK